MVADKKISPPRTVRNDLDLLVEKGWVKVSGATKGRDYELAEMGAQKLSSYG